jgi:hypothetical protein
MRNAVVILLFILLCSNECNKPFAARVTCKNGQPSCTVKLHGPLTFSIQWASVNLWKHRLEVGIRYKVDNAVNVQAEPIDYNSFSVISSRGIKLAQLWKKAGTNGTASASGNILMVPPGGGMDSILVFYSADKYSEKEGLGLLKDGSFSLLYSTNGQTDTICKIAADDNRLK